MTYKQWNLITKKEGNGIAVDYTDPQGNIYNEPFCFHTLDEAVSYGKMRIEQNIRKSEKASV